MNGAVLSSETFSLTTFLASFLIFVMFFGLLILWVIDGKVKKELALHAFLASATAWVIVEMIKTLFPTLRPYELNGGVPLTLTLMHGDGSFPSAHSAVAFALAMTVWFHKKKTGWIFLILAVGVAVGRVLANVHFVLDVIGGCVIGVVVAASIDGLHVHKIIGRSRKTRK